MYFCRTSTATCPSLPQVLPFEAFVHFSSADPPFLTSIFPSVCLSPLIAHLFHPPSNHPLPLLSTPPSRHSADLASLVCCSTHSKKIYENLFSARCNFYLSLSLSNIVWFGLIWLLFWSSLPCEGGGGGIFWFAPESPTTRCVVQPAATQMKIKFFRWDIFSSFSSAVGLCSVLTHHVSATVIQWCWPANPVGGQRKK